MGGRGSKFKENLNIKNVDKIDIKNKDVVNSYCKQTLDYLADFKGYEEIKRDRVSGGSSRNKKYVIKGIAFIGEEEQCPFNE